MACPSPIRTHFAYGPSGGENFDWHFQKRQAPNDVENKRNRLQASPIYTHNIQEEKVRYQRTDHVLIVINVIFVFFFFCGVRGKEGGWLSLILYYYNSHRSFFCFLFFSFLTFILTTLGTFCAPLRFWAPAKEILWRSLHRPMRKQEKRDPKKIKEKPEGEYMYT